MDVKTSFIEMHVFSPGPLGCVALKILCGRAKMWFADSQTTFIVGDPLAQILCWNWIQLKAPRTAGRGFQKDQQKKAWFSEPLNKELARHLQNSR